MWRKALYIIPAAVLLVILLYGRNENKNIILSDKLDHDFPDAQVFISPDTFPRFSLTDTNGNEFTHWKLARMWTLTFFGHAQCDTQCSKTLKKMGEIFDVLSKRNMLGNTQAVFISADPRYDNAQTLKEYMSSFSKDIIGLSGSPDEIKAISNTAELLSRVKAEEFVEGTSSEQGLSFFLIDPLGGIRAVIYSGHDTEQIASDFIGIREKYQEECCITGEEDVKTTTFDFRKKGG